MPWKPSEPGEVPTLGYGVIDWIEENLAHPAFVDVRTWKLYREVEDFILRFYALDPRARNPFHRGLTGRRSINRGLLGRPRGFSKSPVLAALMLAESLGPVVPAGWDADGQPVGAPWSDHTTFLGQVTAVSEDQTKNTWRPLLRMLDGPVIDNYPELEPLGTFVNLPNGVIENRTSAGSSIKGAPSQFVVLDQTEEWTVGNGGLDLADTIRDNVAKVGGSSIESPNAFIPGDGSVAEQSAAFAQSIVEKRALNEGLLYDHREAPPETDMYERESVTLGLRVAYGDAADHPEGCLIHKPPCPPGHVDLDSLINRIWDPDYEPQKARANFLNQITHAATSWIDQPTWAGRYHERCTPPVPALADHEVITLGFDGSRGRFKGKPDATALIGCRVSDGHLFQVDVWEADDDNKKWPGWAPPIVEIEAAIAKCFSRYQVAAFYCDPAKDWRSHVNTWEAKYSARTVKAPKTGKQVHVTTTHPFEWWMTGGRSGLIQRAIEQLEGAIRNGDMTHDGSHALTRHVINARRQFKSGKLTLRKENEYSTKKIDAAVAAVLAWQARLDAVAAGVGERKTARAPRRLDY